MQQVIQVEDVQAALTLPDFDARSAQINMAPIGEGSGKLPEVLPENKGTPPKEAGVLALLYPDQGTLQIVLTRRADTLRGHRGQISFPGGRRDPEDLSFKDTALRETCEELGICENIETLGSLSTYYIPPSHFNVYPYVGYIDHQPDFSPNSDEVAEVFAFGLHQLLDQSYKFTEKRSFNGYRFNVPYYLVNQHKVWGATAAMLSEFECRLRLALALSEE